jgi:hypothetical protein
MQAPRLFLDSGFARFCVRPEMTIVAPGRRISRGLHAPGEGAGSCGRRYAMTQVGRRHVSTPDL